VKELVMVKKMNGNLLRIHVHAWSDAARSVNDPRIAELADQLGVMLIWATPSWIRTAKGWGYVDFEGYPKYMRQVYNHPSIVMWEASNHPNSFKKRDYRESNIFCEKVYDTIYPVDPSRLISTTSYIRHLHYGNDSGTVDFHGHAKLAYYANRMIFQRTCAGSYNVDVVYGPKDTVVPVIMNLGPERTVDLTVEVKNMTGKVIDSAAYKSVHLPGGRTVISLPEFKPSFPSEGYYAIEYRVN
jgi:hypothetical protein